MARSAQPAVEKFWKGVRKTAECWLWEKRRLFGYGYMRLGGRGTPEVRVHRFAYELLVGSIPDDLCVLHRCDVRNCVNPEHLFLGTRADNNADTRQKKRHKVGETHGNARLTAEQVATIRDKYVCRAGSMYTLAKQYGVTPQTIFAVVHRKSWKHVD